MRHLCVPRGVHNYVTCCVEFNAQIFFVYVLLRDAFIDLHHYRLFSIPYTFHVYVHSLWYILCSLA